MVVFISVVRPGWTGPSALWMQMGSAQRLRNSRRVRPLAAGVPLSRSGLVQGLWGRLSRRHAAMTAPRPAPCPGRPPTPVRYQSPDVPGERRAACFRERAVARPGSAMAWLGLSAVAAGLGRGVRVMHEPGACHAHRGPARSGRFAGGGGGGGQVRTLRLRARSIGRAGGIAGRRPGAAARFCAPANGSLLIREIEVQAVTCRDRAHQGLQLRGRGRFRPCRPPALQRDPGGKPGAYCAQRPRPGRRGRW